MPKYYSLVEGFEFMTVNATDADEQGSDNADVRYSIKNQEPPEPSSNMFTINPISGVISVNADGLDREVSPQIRFLIGYVYS